MKINIGIFTFILLVCIACQHPEITITIIYDKDPIAAYPYISFSDVAEVEWTVVGRIYRRTVRNHQSIKIAVPEKTGIKVTYEKISSNGGTVRERKYKYMTASSDHPTWKF